MIMGDAPRMIVTDKTNQSFSVYVSYVGQKLGTLVSSGTISTETLEKIG